MPSRCRSFTPALALAAVAALVGACSTEGIRRDRQAEIARLSTIYVTATAKPPSPAELEERLGQPTALRTGDIAFRSYPTDLEQLVALHDRTREANARAEAAVKTKPDRDAETLSAGDIALAVLLAPIWVPSLAIALPLAGADLAVGHAIAAGDPDQRAARLSGRNLLVAYDEAGNYRWHACCLRQEYFDETGPKPVQLPDPERLRSEGGVVYAPASYREDYIAMTCFRAKAGDVSAQAALYHAFNQSVPDRAATYYWARLMRDTAGDWGVTRFKRMTDRLTSEEARAGADNFRAHPLDTLDCRRLAAQLIASRDAGTKGPNF